MVGNEGRRFFSANELPIIYFFLDFPASEYAIAMICFIGRFLSLDLSLLACASSAIFDEMVALDDPCLSGMINSPIRAALPIRTSIECF